MNPKQFVELLRMTRTDTSVGDLAAFKLSLLSNPSLNEQVTPEQLNFSIDADHLRSLPDGTLGKEYIRFLDGNGLEHLDVTPAMRERLKDDPYAVRFSLTHDMHHLIAGFDTGIAGEIGVAAFNAGQGTGPLGEFGLRMQALVSCLLVPTQAKAIWSNVNLGLAVGQRSKCLLTASIEEWLERPLTEVREELGIRASDLATIKDSGRSSAITWMYEQMGRVLPPIAHPPR